MPNRKVSESLFLPPAETQRDRTMNQAIVDLYRVLARHINSDITAGLLADRPASDGSNRLYWATDTGFLYFDSVSGWAQVTGLPSTGTMANLIIEAPAAGDTDPWLQFDIVSGGAFRVGVDDSDSDALVICSGTALGTNVQMRFLAGAVSIPNGALSVGGGGLTVSGGSLSITNAGSLSLQQAEGALCEVKTFRESLTTNATPKDTSATLLPANAIILDVTVRVTTALSGTLTTFSVGDPTTATRFLQNVSKALNTTAVGIDHWSGAVTTLGTGPSQAATAKVRITATSGTLTAGVVEIIVHAIVFTPPSS